MSTDAELAWAAGLFEGEGSFHVTTTKWGSRIASMGISMSDRDVLEQFQRIVNSGRVRGPQFRGAHRKPMYTIDIAERAAVKRVTLEFMPWLGRRRSGRAREILFLIEELDAAAKYRKQYCKYGHPWTVENSYVSPRGIRACRECKRVAGREWMRQKRAGAKLAS